MSKAPPRTLLRKQFAEQVGRTRRGQQKQQHDAQQLSGTPFRATSPTTPWQSLQNLRIRNVGREQIQQRGSASGWDLHHQKAHQKAAR
jgi:hypothetical protein